MFSLHTGRIQKCDYSTTLIDFSLKFMQIHIKLSNMFFVFNKPASIYDLLHPAPLFIYNSYNGVFAPTFSGKKRRFKNNE